jgi:hypothetical protein
LDFGSVGVDDDGDGLTERAGDCNDRDPRWDTATLPAVVVAIDLTRGRSAPPSVRAPTPYLQLSERAPAHTFWMEDLTDRQIKAKKKEKRKKDREPEKEEAEAEEHEIEEVEEAGVEGEEKQVKKPASPPNPRLHHGSVWARSIIRSESEEGEEPRPIDFAPDHIRVGERWKRRTSPEFRMGVGLAWSPFAALSSRCDPDFDGISVSCPLGADGALIDEKRTTWDLTGNGVQGTFQAYVTTWGAGAARHGLDAGIELSLHLLVPGVWGPGNSDLLRLAQLRPTVSVLVGPRVLPLPALRVPRPGPAWGEPRFSRVELGLRAGWSTTALPDGVEGGPLVELWFGESLRSRGSRTPVSATMTPYRPKGLLGGFIRGELFMPVPSGGTGDRATYLHLGAVVSVGVRGSFALGMREVKESDVPDLESLERPGLPGLPGLGGGG